MASSQAAFRKRVRGGSCLLWVASIGLALGGVVWTAGATMERWMAEDLRQNLFDVCFVNDQEGWVVADLGRIFHTTDGAQTWLQQDPGTRKPFVSITCPDRNNLWIAGQAGQIAMSTDGGQSWKPQDSQTERQLLDIKFQTTRRGIAVGDFGTIRRTDDGGATWTKVPLPEDTRLPEDIAEIVQPGDVVIYSVSFGDADHVWIVGEFGVILNSTDGGLTFQAQESPVETSLFGVYFADAERGWAVGLEETLLSTTDGGITWVKQEVESPRGFELALYDVAVSGNNGWAVGNSGILLYSSDAGATWNLMDVPVKLRSGWFRGISLLPDGRGYVVGARGMVVALDADTIKALKEDY